MVLSSSRATQGKDAQSTAGRSRATDRTAARATGQAAAAQAHTAQAHTAQAHAAQAHTAQAHAAHPWPARQAGTPGLAAGSAGSPTNPAPRVIAPPPRRRRSLWGILAGVLLVISGAVLAGWLFQVRGGNEEVLAVVNDIARGEVIGPEDLATARITSDPALRPIPASERDRIVGLRAARDMAAGSLVTEQDTTTMLLPQEGMAVVGVSVTTAMAPGMSLQYGDRVRIVLTPGTQEDPGSVPPPVDAVVVGVHSGTAGTVGQGTSTVDVQVRSDQAAALATRAVAGQVAIVLDARES